MDGFSDRETCSKCQILIPLGSRRCTKCGTWLTKEDDSAQTVVLIIDLLFKLFFFGFH
jgi:hypothetical protein